MSHQHVIKAWKDPAYRNGLSPTEREALPPNPAGAIEISDEALGHFVGGIEKPPPHTVLCNTQMGCTIFQECSNLGCPTVICTITGCLPILPL
jgi:mersacidin/lichenicidin family type 2 lantibiotic